MQLLTLFGEAELRSRLVLIDSFAEHDEERLKEVLGEQYIPFTTEEINQLKKVPAVNISNAWFMNYVYSLDNEAQDGATRRTDFMNPTTLENSHFLHVWKIFSTSPFENGVVFSSNSIAISSVEINPSEMSVSAGQKVQLTANVTTTGFANKAVIWEIASTPEGNTAEITVNQNGVVNIPKSAKSGTLTVKATSIYDNTKTATATITIL